MFYQDQLYHFCCLSVFLKKSFFSIFLNVFKIKLISGSVYKQLNFISALLFCVNNVMNIFI